MKSRNERATSTLRLIHAALKDRDIAARSRGKADGIDDAEILAMLQSMIKQRQESIAHFRQGNRPDLAQREQEEIAIIESYLPQQLDAAAVEGIVRDLVAELGASSIKDMGRTMQVLRERYAGQIDIGKASALVKQHLSR